MLIKNDSADSHHRRYIVEMILFFVVLTHPLNDPIPINISEVNIINNHEILKDKLTFGNLKSYIWNIIKNREDDSNHDYLMKLWKVEDLEEGKEKWKELETLASSYTETDIENFGGNKLLSTNKVLEVFRDVSENKVHIIVQPPPPATTGKRRCDGDEDQNRKKSKLTVPETILTLVQTMEDIMTTTGKRRCDGDEDQNRKKSKLTVPETILTLVQKTMEDIMKLSDDPNVYSNPENLIPLPFPFIGDDKPVDRFSINNDGKFTYMGRKAFGNVLDVISELVLPNGYKKCFIYGTMGYGKSHILATIVCFLFRIGKRVVYIPDCRELAMNAVRYVKSALYLAYKNNSDKINKIHACETLDQIVEFCMEESEPLYFVVDQMNALDGHNNTEIDETTKRRIVGFLGRIASKHYYIKSSSANNISALRLKLKQTNEKKIELYGGFNEDEMSRWWIKNNSNLPSMNDEQRKEIEYITGRNPLFLNFLPGSEKIFEDVLGRLHEKLIEKIKMPMINFSDIIKRSERWDIHVDLMSSCLTNGYAPSGHGINDYDHRFFYIKKDERCYYTSGFVRDCMADYLFEKGRLEVFNTSSWIQCIKEFKNNPSVMGFMVEKACLSSIFKNGFMAEKINFKPNNYKFFTSLKEINFSMNEGPCTLYLPRRWNQKSIDGLITLHKLKNKKEKVDEDTLYIVPIQITFDKETHSDSEASFFSGIWPELKSRISGDLKVEVIFIWFTRENDVDYFVEANEKILKGRTIEINPPYTSVATAFRCINIELENVLSY